MKINKVFLLSLVGAGVLFTTLSTDASAAKKSNIVVQYTKDDLKNLKIGDTKTISNKKGADIVIKIKGKEIKYSDLNIKTNKKSVVEVKKIKGFNFKLKAKKKGKASLVITDKKKSFKKSYPLVVKVNKPDNVEENGVKAKYSLSQLDENSFILSGITDVNLAKSISKSDVLIKDVTGNSDLSVKDVSYNDKDGSLVIKTPIRLNKNNTYNVKIDKLGFSSDVVISDAKVSKIDILTDSIPVNVDREIKYKVFDDKGVDITNSSKAFININVDFENGKGYYNKKDNILTLYSLNTVAKVSINYNNGNVNVNSDKKIKAIEKSDAKLVVSKYGISSEDNVDFSKLSSVKDATIPINNKNIKFYIELNTDSGKSITNMNNPSVEIYSTNESIFKVNGNKIEPVGKGEASIVVKLRYEGREFSYTPMKLSIGDEAIVTKIELQDSNVILNKDKPDGIIKISKILDQYNNEYPGYANAMLSCVPITAGVSGVNVNVVDKQIIINKGSSKAGTYIYKVRSANSPAEATFGVIVQ